MFCFFRLFCLIFFSVFSCGFSAPPSPGGPYFPSATVPWQTCATNEAAKQLYIYQMDGGDIIIDEDFNAGSGFYTNLIMFFVPHDPYYPFYATNITLNYTDAIVWNNGTNSNGAINQDVVWPPLRFNGSIIRNSENDTDFQGFTPLIFAWCAGTMYRDMGPIWTAFDSNASVTNGRRICDSEWITYSTYAKGFSDAQPWFWNNTWRIPNYDFTYALPAYKIIQDDYSWFGNGSNGTSSRGDLCQHYFNQSYSSFINNGYQHIWTFNSYPPGFDEYDDLSIS